MNRETSQHPISVSRISIFGKICLYMLITIAVSQSISAQPSLEATYNMIRSGDKLIKQTVESTNPGQAGEDIIWDFSRQKITNKEHYLSNKFEGLLGYTIFILYRISRFHYHRIRKPYIL